MEALPVYMRRAHGHDQSWRDTAKCRLPQPELTAQCGTVTALPFEQAEEIVRRQVWTTDTLGAIHVSILGRRMLAAEVETLALMVCNGCPAQWGCAAYALEADETVGTWAIPQSWLEEIRRNRILRAKALVLIEGARRRQQKMQAFWRTVLFKGDTPR